MPVNAEVARIWRAGCIIRARLLEWIRGEYAAQDLTTLCAGRLPAALVQGQRDYFGAHTYRRVDDDGFFHTAWSADRAELRS